MTDWWDKMNLDPEVIAERSSEPPKIGSILTRDERTALEQILDYAAKEHSKSQQGYFSEGWAGKTLRALLARAISSEDTSRKPESPAEDRRSSQVIIESKWSNAMTSTQDREKARKIANGVMGYSNEANGRLAQEIENALVNFAEDARREDKAEIVKLITLVAQLRQSLSDIHLICADNVRKVEAAKE